MQRKWTFSLLWINIAVALVVLFEAANGQVHGSREVFHLLAYSLAYANITGILASWILGNLTTRLARRNVPLVLVVALGVILLTAFGSLLVQALLTTLGFVVPQNFWQQYFLTLRIAMPLAIVFGLGAFVHGSLLQRVQTMQQALREKEINEERTHKLVAEARLRSLESRLHPHFLFNTLNSISSLIVVNPTEAERLVGRLASLLRASLDTTHQSLIPLHQELGLVESYLAIERMRFGDKLIASLEVPVELQQARVPPMSIQSLVENAVKHGINPQGGGRVLITALADNGALHIEVRDTGPGFDLAVIRAGHGLDNLVQRLDTLFAAQAGMNVFRRDGYAVVEMVLPRL